MATKNFKPIEVKPQSEMYANTDALRNTIRSKIKKEPAAIRSTVRVPELALMVKLRKGQNIKDWLVRYCRSHPIVKTRIYNAYGITLDYEEATIGGNISNVTTKQKQ